MHGAYFWSGWLYKSTCIRDTGEPNTASTLRIYRILVGGEQGGETVFQSGADIGNMRGADRRTNGIVANALLRQLFSGELSAGYDGMDHREMGKPSQVWCCKRGETIMRKRLSDNLRLFMQKGL